jgi:hypothetical protein
MLVAFGMPAYVISECLGSVTGECLDGVADDGQLPRGDGEVGTLPGLQLPFRRMELHEIFLSDRKQQLLREEWMGKSDSL